MCRHVLNVNGTTSMNWIGIRGSPLWGVHAILLYWLYVTPRMPSNRLYVMLVVVTMHLRWLLLLMVYLVAVQLSWGVVLKLLVGVYVWCIGVC